MLPTHALVGLLLALPFALSMPEFGDVALVTGFLGGVVPDLDMYVGHRRTLHYPVYFTALAAGAVPVTLLFPSTATVAVAFLLLGAAVHSVGDMFGGGLELRPWEATSDRAVYDHSRRQWIPPRHWVRYDGAPEDLLLSLTTAVPLLVALDGWLRWIVIASLTVATVYTAVRRFLPIMAEFLFVDLLPDRMVDVAPDRYLTGD